MFSATTHRTVIEFDGPVGEEPDGIVEFQGGMIRHDRFPAKGSRIGVTLIPDAAPLAVIDLLALVHER